MNSAILSRTGGNVGIGFALPANLIRQIRDRLQEDGTVARGWLGVVIQDLTPDLAPAFGAEARHGALVSQVQSDSPAAKGGVQPGDVLTAVDGKPLANVGSLRNAVGLRRPGETVRLEVLREGAPHTLAVELGSRPGSADAPSTVASPASAMGLTVEPLDATWKERLGTEAETGLVITAVDPGSSAERAGLRPGMVVLSAGRQPVRSAADLERARKRTIEGQPLLLRVLGRASHPASAQRPGPGDGSRPGPLTRRHRRSTLGSAERRVVTTLMRCAGRGA